MLARIGRQQPHLGQMIGAILGQVETDLHDAAAMLRLQFGRRDTGHDDDADHIDRTRHTGAAATRDGRTFVAGEA
jgi:hypothetical protein